ncbi:hypothetical protein M407DRAFT_9162 [Tulasnella calospora MUT 4182]|uniref:Uncharacterized protein n=1 Tax=Tulasnella calospora MUT 4182 TaxID=1051891 RepID=A0A0C3KRB9_9AGAM|nr:hypothetical protein M407DRAFT_9162 [Tulasnella calospora MUT 4182]
MAVASIHVVFSTMQRHCVTNDPTSFKNPSVPGEFHVYRFHMSRLSDSLWSGLGHSKPLVRVSVTSATAVAPPAPPFLYFSNAFLHLGSAKPVDEINGAAGRSAVDASGLYPFPWLDRDNLSQVSLLSFFKVFEPKLGIGNVFPPYAWSLHPADPFGGRLGGNVDSSPSSSTSEASPCHPPPLPASRSTPPAEK